MDSWPLRKNENCTESAVGKVERHTPRVPAELTNRDPPDKLFRMRFLVPFRGVDRRTAWLRVVLLTACFFGLTCSHGVWLNNRSFPLLPIAPWFPVLPSPWDKCFFGIMLLTLGLALRFYRKAVILFLKLAWFAFCEDQNRGQPWLYLYGVMLAFTLFRAPLSLATNQSALSVAYLWSGIQKCNPGFFRAIPAWFVTPAGRHWHLPGGWIELLRCAIASAPFVEIGIGVGLWLSLFRRAAMGAVVVLHLTALLLLGPLGHNYDTVIWPWNLAMIALTLVLFTSDGFWQKSTPDAASTSSPKRTVAIFRPVSASKRHWRHWAVRAWPWWRWPCFLCCRL
jgi:hypothetical protein